MSMRRCLLVFDENSIPACDNFNDFSTKVYPRMLNVSTDTFLFLLLHSSNLGALGMCFYVQTGALSAPIFLRCGFRTHATGRHWNSKLGQTKNMWKYI